MASRFVLSAALTLQPPKNVRQVVNAINTQLQGVTAPVNLAVNSQGISKANAQLKSVSATAAGTSKNLRGAARSADSFGAALGSAARRFASITLATGFFLAITRALGSAVGRAIEFEKEMLKISQVTGKTVRQLGELSGEVTRLATSLGVSSEEILNSARTLSQAGFAAKDVTKALEILAQTDLAATFDNIKDTTEGAVAILRQFRKEVVAAGGEVQFLRQAMDAINAVSKNFAVESADLISVVRRTGGVFEAAGGKLNELIALFTSVRGTTRETADTIATGFRTIFTRIQRTETIDQLKELGIVLQDSTGKFVGPLEAIKRLSIGLSSLDPRDFRFNEIVEQLGGFRQIGKVIPLIKQYQMSTQALAVANDSLGSTANDAAIAQQGLGNQFSKLKEKFDATVRSLTESDTFRGLAESAITLAESILKIVEALEPLLPMLTALAAFKMGQIAIPAFGRFAGMGGMGGRNQGGRIHAFASGGYVPGQGSRDTVPAMLTPGEFVIKKSSVKKIGAQKLAKMNGYNGGGNVQNVQYFTNGTSGKGVIPDEEVDGFVITGNPGMLPGLGYTMSEGISGSVQSLSGSVRQEVMTNYAGLMQASPAAREVGMGALGANDQISMSVPFINAPANASLAQSGDEGYVVSHLQKAVGDMASEIAARMEYDVPPSIMINEQAAASSALAKIDMKSIAGFMFEAVVSNLTQAKLAPGEGWDIPNVAGKKQRLEKLFGGKGSMANLAALELKRTMSGDNIRGSKGSLTTKIINTVMGKSNVPAAQLGLKIRRTAGTPDAQGVDLAAVKAKSKALGKNFGGRIGKYATGGKADTVPSMLTPGEYVINKSAAQKIGYGNLNRMNKHGVSNFNAGGPVQYFAGGTGVSGVGGLPPGGGGTGMGAVNTSMTALAEAATAVSLQLDALKTILTGAVDDFVPLQAAIANASTGISGVDEMMKGAITAAVQPLGPALIEASKGISMSKNIMLEGITAALAPLATAMIHAAKGIEMADDVMLKALTAALAPLKTAVGIIEAGFKTFVEKLQTMVTPFEALKKPNTDLVTVMEKLVLSFNATLDDFAPLQPKVFALSESIDNAGIFMSRLWEFFLPLHRGIQALSTAMQTAAVKVASGAMTSMGGMGASGGGAKMAGVMGRLALELETVAINMGFIASSTAYLRVAIGKMIQALLIGAVGIQNITVISGGTGTQFQALQQELIAVKAELAELKLKADQAGNQLATTGTTARGGGAVGGGGGASMMANQFLMVAMMAGMMVTQFMDLDAATEKAVNAAVMLGSIFGMMALAVMDHIQTKVAEIAAGKAAAATDGEKAGAAKVASSADIEKAAAAKASARAALMASIAMLGLSIVVGIIAFRMIHAAEAAKELSKELAEGMREFSRGEGEMDLDQAKTKAKAALKLEAEAAAGFSGAITGAVAGIALAALVISTGGLALGIAIVAAGALIGNQSGIAGAAIEASLATVTNTFITSAFHAAKALNEFAAAAQEIQLLQLEGKELMKAQTTAGAALSLDTGKSTAQFMKGRMDLTGLTSGDAESETLQDQQESASEMLSSAVDANFQAANDLASSLKSTASEMREGGASFTAIMDDAGVKESLAQYTKNVYQAVQAQSILNGSARRLAAERLGLVGMTEEEMTLVQRRLLIAETAAQADIQATEASEASARATRDRLKAEDEATRQAKASQAVKLAADRLLSMKANELAISLNTLATSLIGFSSQISLMDVELGSLTGSIRQYKSANTALIATLNSGQVTDEAAGAARSVGDRFGIRNEVDTLLGDIRDSDKLRQKLRDQGLKPGTEGGLGGAITDPALTGTRLQKFLKSADIDLSGLAPEIRQEIMDMLQDGLKPDEIEKIMDLVNDSNKERIKVLQDLAKAEQGYLDGLFKFGGAIIKSQNEYMKSLQELTKVQIRGASRIAQAEGRELTVQEVAGQGVAQRRAGMGAVGLAGGAGVAGTALQLRSVTEKMTQADENLRILIKNGADPEDIIKTQNAQQQLVNQVNVLKNNLKELANQAALAAAIMGEIELERSKREAVRNLISDFTFANNEGRRQMDQNMMALQRVMQTGNLNSIPDEMRGAVGTLLDQLKDIDLGGGMTGGDVKKRLEMQMANQLAIRQRGFGLTPEEMKKIFERTTKEEKLINDLRALNAEEQNAARLLADLEFAEMQKLVTALGELRATLNNAMIVVGANPAGALAPPGAGGAGAVVQGNAKGGPVNFNGGGLAEGMAMVDFKKQGTDTIPAMLTKGEFVVNAAAAKKNAGLLQKMNTENVSYFNKGGWTDRTQYSFQKGNEIETLRPKIKKTLSDTKTLFGDRALEYSMEPMEYQEYQQKKDLETTFANGGTLKNVLNWYPNDGDRTGFDLSRYDTLKDLGEKLSTQVDADNADHTAASLGKFMTANDLSDPNDYFAMQRVFVGASRAAGGIYDPDWWNTKLKFYSESLGMTIKRETQQDWDDNPDWLPASDWLVDDKTRAAVAWERLIQKPLVGRQRYERRTEGVYLDPASEGGDEVQPNIPLAMKTLYNTAPLKEVTDAYAQAVPLGKFGDERPTGRWLAQIQATIDARGAKATMFDNAFKSPAGYWENLTDLKGWDHVDFKPLSDQERDAPTNKMYGGSLTGWSANTHEFSKRVNRGPADEIMHGLLKTKKDRYSYPEMDEEDWTRYGVQGIGKEYGPAWYQRTLGDMEVGTYRDNIYSKYDWDLGNYIDKAAAGGKEIRDFYSMYDPAADVDAKDAQEAKLAGIIANIQAIKPPIEVTANQLGAGGEIERLFNETAWASVKGRQDAPTPGGIFGALGYVPWDAEQWSNFSNVYQDVKGAAPASKPKIKDAQDIYGALTKGMTAADFAGKLDKASTTLRGIPSDSGMRLKDITAAAKPAQVPQAADEEMLAEVGAFDVDAIVAHFNSPFMNDDKKKAGLVGAWEWYQDQAKKYKMAGNPVAAGNAMRIAPIFPYIKRQAGNGVDFGANSWIGQMPATAELFNAMFPYFAGPDQTDALAPGGLGDFGSIESQIREGVKYGFVTGLDAKGPLFNNNALTNRAMATRRMDVPGVGEQTWEEFTVGKDTEAAVKLLYHWISSKHMDLNNVGGPPGRDEKWMMHRFFNIMNVDKALNHLESNSLRSMDGLVKLGNKQDDKGVDIEGTSGKDILRQVLGENFAGKVVDNIGAEVGNIPAGFATGGHVGSTHMSPSGTDTVPAMLTPGEFVMKKSAVDKYGIGFMSSLNGGNIGSGGPYFDEGGLAAVGEIDKAFNSPTEKIEDWLLSNVDSDVRTAEQLLGDKLRVQLPADVGAMLNMQASAELLNGKTGRLMQFSDPGNVREVWNSRLGEELFDKIVGYVHGSVMLGVPKHSGNMSKENFGSIFGEDASKAFYPYFPNVWKDQRELPPVNLHNKDKPMIRGRTPEEQGYNVNLSTGSRDYALQTLGATDKFFAEVQGLFNKISNTPMVTSTKLWGLGKLADDGSGFTGEKVNGREVNRTRLGYMPESRIHFDAGWLTEENQGDIFKDGDLPYEWLDIAAKILPSGQHRQYLQAQYTAKRNATALGHRVYRAEYFPREEGFQKRKDQPGRPMFNAGGSVPGAGNRDTVSAMLTPGEFVMKKSAVDKYGAGFMSSVNSGLAHFAGGGPVGRASSQFGERDSTSSLLRAMSGSLSSIDSSNRNILTGQGSLQEGQQTGFGAVEGGLGAIGPEISTRFDDLVGRLDAAFFSISGNTFAAGGSIPGAGSRDTVPAMLTPGEFVMKKSAVAKYGLGFMRSINDSSHSVRVGRGTQYMNGGDKTLAGPGMDFFSGISNAISDLGSTIFSSLSAFETAFLGFNKLSAALNDTINKIANLHITHNINMSGTLDIPGFSQAAIDSIIREIGIAVAQSTDGKLKRALRNFKDRLDNSTG